MGEFRRAADGRRMFSAEFKWKQVERISTGEVTQAQLARGLGVSAGLIRRWRQLVAGGAEVAVAANGDVVPARQLREVEVQIRELERALGRKTLEVEILQGAREEVKKSRSGTACPPADRPSCEDHLPGAGDRPCHGVPHAQAATPVPTGSAGR